MGFFVFLKEALVEERQKTKKTQGFLFFSWILHTFLLNIWPKNQKNLDFFLCFALLQLRFPSKNQKNQGFFLVFKNLNQKKLKEHQKKHLLTWNQNFSKKFWFFGFLEVSFGFKNLNQKKTKKLKENQKKQSSDLKPKLLQKVLFFWFFGFLEVSSHSLFLFGRNSGSRIESVFHGNIYKIVVVGYNLCYLGSTCEKLSKRMERHRAEYKNYVDGKKHFTTSYQYQMNMEKRKSELIENDIPLSW